jgi:cytochrome c553
LAARGRRRGARLRGAGHGARGERPLMRRAPPGLSRRRLRRRRQLFDMQVGVRKGPSSALMKSAVEKLTVDDMIAIAAYTSSREP